MAAKRRGRRKKGRVMDGRVAALLAMTGDYLAGVAGAAASARLVLTSRTIRRTSKKLT